MDVPLSVRFTATERLERGAVRWVLIDSDLWSEHSLDDPCTALCVIELSRALQMESYPKFHNEVGVPIVRIGCREFKCIGDRPPQDHPHIYLDMGDTSGSSNAKFSTRVLATKLSPRAAYGGGARIAGA